MTYLDGEEDLDEVGLGEFVIINRGNAFSGPTMYDDMFLSDYDVDANDGRGWADWTKNENHAMKFPKATDAWDCWRQVSTVRPFATGWEAEPPADGVYGGGGKAVGRIPKELWGPGPWQDEPDRVDWMAFDRPAMLIRNMMTGAWCGYAGLYSEDRWFGKSYDGCTKSVPCTKYRDDMYCDHEIQSMINVHGGITLATSCSGHICHVPRPGEPDDVWWFGFDAGHCYDLQPAMNALLAERGALLPWVGEDVYRDLAYMVAETTSLAEQLLDVPR